MRFVLIPLVIIFSWFVSRSHGQDVTEAVRLDWARKLAQAPGIVIPRDTMEALSYLDFDNAQEMPEAPLVYCFLLALFGDSQINGMSPSAMTATQFADETGARWHDVPITEYLRGRRLDRTSHYWKKWLPEQSGIEVYSTGESPEDLATIFHNRDPDKPLFPNLIIACLTFTVVPIDGEVETHHFYMVANPNKQNAPPRLLSTIRSSRIAFMPDTEPAVPEELRGQIEDVRQQQQAARQNARHAQEGLLSRFSVAQYLWAAGLAFLVLSLFLYVKRRRTGI